MKTMTMTITLTFEQAVRLSNYLLWTKPDREREITEMMSLIEANKVSKEDIAIVERQIESLKEIDEIRKIIDQ